MLAPDTTFLQQSSAGPPESDVEDDESSSKSETDSNAEDDDSDAEDNENTSRWTREECSILVDLADRTLKIFKNGRLEYDAIKIAEGIPGKSNRQVASKLSAAHNKKARITHAIESFGRTICWPEGHS